ncbi:uncharacterized protein ACNS7B_012692 isoform 1-T1 [Menidia menidia]
MDLKDYHQTKGFGSYWMKSSDLLRQAWIDTSLIHQTEQRLQSLRRRFEKDAQYKEEYTACVNNMLQQGYAEAVPADELQKDVTEESLLNKRWQICQKKEFCQPPLLSQTLEWITLVLLYSSKRIMDDGQSFECKPGRTGLGAFRAVANQDQCVGKTCDQTSVATGSITLRN